VGLAAQGHSAEKAREHSKEARTSHLRNVGMWHSRERESHRPVTPGHKERILKVINEGLNYLADLSKELKNEINAFDEHNPQTYSREEHQEKLQKIHEETTLCLERMQ
jgi:hypothetical protein